MKINVISTAVSFVLMVNAAKMRKYPVRKGVLHQVSAQNASFIS